MSRYTNLTPFIQDSNGNPIVGAKTYFYESGTTTLKTIYSDSNFATPIANPVISLAGGILPTIFLDGLYKVAQHDENDVSIYPSEDPIGDISTSQFSDWINDATYSINDIVRADDTNFYKSLVDDNQGNEPSVSPTEWGDATFVTLDGTETLTNKTLTSPVINTPIINGVTGYGLVVLDTPEKLTTVPIANNTWVSSGLLASTTLSAAGAVKAIIKIYAKNTGASVLESSVSAYISKGGTSPAKDTNNLVCTATADPSTAGNPTAPAVGEVLVNLDSNSDFVYATITLDATSADTLVVTLVGYYV